MAGAGWAGFMPGAGGDKLGCKGQSLRLQHGSIIHCGTGGTCMEPCMGEMNVNTKLILKSK